MNKWQQLKEAVKNPPPDRLAKIEYQSHFLQMGGITIVSIILLAKGLWYIIFSFIFALGINYSQGMGALRKYQNIKSLMPVEKPKDYVKDISFTRKRGKIIEYIYGSKARWVSLIFSIIITWGIIGDNFHWLLRSVLFFFLAILVHLVLYYLIIYKIAFPLYKKRV